MLHTRRSLPTPAVSSRALLGSVLALLALLAGDARAQSACTPAWEPLFGGEPGLGKGDAAGDPDCAVVFDDGSGPALYVAGNIVSAGGKPTPRIARWDGSSWSAVGAELTGIIHDMVVFDDGGGPALYAGGNISTVGGTLVHNLLKWDGSTWTEVGGGTDGTIHSLTVVDDGPEVLVLGGSFSSAGGTPAEGVALWTGSAFLPFGDGLDGAVFDVAVHDGEIYAGGVISASGATPLNNLARWNGSAWEDVSGGVGGTVNTLLSYGVGAEHGLHVGGQFGVVGPGAGIPASRVARWQAGTWSALGSGTNNVVHDLLAWDDGSGEALYAAGQFTSPGTGFDNAFVGRWDGSAWSPLGTGLDECSAMLVVHDDGDGEKLWVGGRFAEAGDAPASGIARWDGVSWSAVGSGLNRAVLGVHASDLGGDPVLWVGGHFNVPGTVDERHVTVWNDGAWLALGGANAAVRGFVEFDDGSGPAVYAYGGFTQIGGVSVDRIAKWDADNFTWIPLGDTLSGTIHDAVVFDDGSGPALYVGGLLFGFEDVARWDGSTWSSVGGGIPGTRVNALEVFDDGSGPALHASGSFSTGTGAVGNGIQKWDGTSWSALGSGLTGGAARGLDLATFDDGSGPALYVGGIFDAAGGVPGSAGLARWDGASWSAVGDIPLGSVDALQPYADGEACALYIAGDFDAIDGMPFANIARWDGVGWSALGSGFPTFHFGLEDLELFDAGDGPLLVAAGGFTTQPDTPGGASYLATWGGCWDGVDAWTDLGSALPGVSGDPLLTGSGSLALGSTNHVVLSNAAPSAPAAVFVAPSSMPTSFAGGTLIPFPFLGPFFAVTSPAGTIALAYEVEECLFAGLELYIQWGIDDDAAVSGIALSNAILGEAP